MKANLIARVSRFALLLFLALSICGVHAKAQGEDRRLIVVNNMAIPVWHLYASPIRYDNPRWGGDRLGDDVIDPGYNLVLDITDGTGYCRYDFLAVLADGHEYFEHDVNVCEETVISIP